MTGQNTWSYRPYRPFCTEVGDIYITRIVPYVDKIHLEWLATDARCEIFLRKRGEGAFACVGTTDADFFDLEGLGEDEEYEFFVASGEKKSRTRLARCSRSVGTVVNYLHPDDEVYAFSGRYLASPSLVRHPDGYLLASMDVFASLHPQNLTLIFRSDDDGATWHYVCELMPCFWGKMFIHKGELYMLSCATEYGDLLIGKSEDGGKTFSAPTVLLRGSNGKNCNTGVHKNPQNIVHHGGRIYETLEWGSWGNQDYRHAAMVMSCREDDDLLVPENWHFTPPRRFERFTPEMQDLPENSMTIEGTLVLAPDGRLLNAMRFEKYGHALVYEVNTEAPDAMLTYSHLMKFPANFSKFMIKRDAVTGDYYSVATRLYCERPSTRNLLSLLRSHDLVSWEVVTDLLDYRHESADEVGFQYVDFEFEGDAIIFLCRTAIGGAKNFHDTNYATFHRVEKFREISP